MNKEKKLFGLTECDISLCLLRVVVPCCTPFLSLNAMLWHRTDLLEKIGGECWLLWVKEKQPAVKEKGGLDWGRGGTLRDLEQNEVNREKGKGVWADEDRIVGEKHLLHLTSHSLFCWLQRTSCWEGIIVCCSSVQLCCASAHSPLTLYHSALYHYILRPSKRMNLEAILSGLNLHSGPKFLLMKAKFPSACLSFATGIRLNFPAWST